MEISQGKEVDQLAYKVFWALRKLSEILLLTWRIEGRKHCGYLHMCVHECMYVCMYIQVFAHELLWKAGSQERKSTEGGKGGRRRNRLKIRKRIQGLSI